MGGGGGGVGHGGGGGGGVGGGGGGGVGGVGGVGGGGGGHGGGGVGGGGGVYFLNSSFSIYPSMNYIITFLCSISRIISFYVSCTSKREANIETSRKSIFI